MRLAFLLFAVLGLSANAAELTVSSPDDKITLTITDSDTYSHYQVSFQGKQVIRPSRLGFAFEKAKPLYRNLALTEVSRDSEDSTWEQPWGEQRIIRNHYNELTVKLTDRDDKNNALTLQVRVFNDGVGFRYHVKADGPRAIAREMTEFSIVDSHTATAYWIPGQGYER